MSSISKMISSSTNKVVAKADVLAQQYLAASDSVKEAEHELANIRETVMGAADGADAVVDGNTRFLQGKLYKVGKTAVFSKPSLDADKLRTLLTPAQIAVVFKKVQVEQLDEDALVKLVESGKLSSKILAKATNPSEFKHNRILVEKL